MPKPLIGVNEQGRRVGESHKDARLSDHEIEVLREMHEVHGFGYRRLARIFELAVATVRDICKYRTRAQRPVRFKPGCA